MGANLVIKVLASWTHVTDRAFRVLVRMAVTALDKPSGDTPAGVYFAGRDLLAMSLRSDGGTEQSRNRAVARAVAELVEAGAIERTDSGRTGHNAVYKLTLSEAKIGNKRTDQGGQFSHPQGGQISHPKGGQFDPIRVANSTTPRNQEEPIEELREEEAAVLSTASHPLRAKTPLAEPAPVVELFPGVSQEARYRPTPRWSSQGVDAIAEATARRAAARAAYQAAQEAQ